MTTARLKAGVLGVEGVASTDRWYVTNGATAVGPVHLDLIARGIENGQVPLQAFLRHDTWKVWRPLADFAVVVEASLDEPVSDDTPLPRFTLASANDQVTDAPGDLRSLANEEQDAEVCQGADSAPEIPISFQDTPSSEALNDDEIEEIDFGMDDGRALNASGSWPLCDSGIIDSGIIDSGIVVTAPDSVDVSFEVAEEQSSYENPPPPDLSDDITTPARTLRGKEPLPEDALLDAADLQDALLLTLASAVHSTSSDAAILHRVDDDGAFVTCAHGPDMLNMLGARTRLLDAAVVAAAAASTVIAEPTPGVAGAAIIERLSRLGVSAEGAFMVPIRPHGRLLALLEVGRMSRYRALDVAKVEKLVDALVREIETRGWSAPQSVTGVMPMGSSPTVH